MAAPGDGFLRRRAEDHPLAGQPNQPIRSGFHHQGKDKGRCAVAAVGDDQCLIGPPGGVGLGLDLKPPDDLPLAHLGKRSGWWQPAGHPGRQPREGPASRLPAQAGRPEGSRYARWQWASGRGSGWGRRCSPGPPGTRRRVGGGEGIHRQKPERSLLREREVGGEEGHHLLPGEREEADGLKEPAGMPAAKSRLQAQFYHRSHPLSAGEGIYQVHPAVGPIVKVQLLVELVPELGEKLYHHTGSYLSFGNGGRDTSSIPAVCPKSSKQGNRGRPPPYIWCLLAT